MIEERESRAGRDSTRRILPAGARSLGAASDVAAIQSGTARQWGGSYRTLPLSRHATTHIDLLRQLLFVTIDVEKETVPKTAAPFRSRRRLILVTVDADSQMQSGCRRQRLRAGLS